ncbi:hypothetical protein VSH64_08660 [Amycolatopsis rhabdoformis]|uniref:Integral membrane protein n=1 Tax=Amycolatopsis rhabdoformis TaxID=1448059 RepID=A0ABZ1IF52_9PSEU|nr:hypothetical protein [Amycolatopsis rhabdoformis]WSE32179.1 hypothetical protein VSH64_08660 [Amycolatopsis rhabdoformis]
MLTRRGRAALHALAVYETLFALSAVVGGIGLMARAPGFDLPTADLAPLGLHSWVLPGAALAVAIGGVLGLAAAVAWRTDRRAPYFAYAACAVLVGWLAIQFTVIGAHQPAQWMTVAMAGLLAVLGRYTQRVVGA